MKDRSSEACLFMEISTAVLSTDTAITWLTPCETWWILVKLHSHSIKLCIKSPKNVIVLKLVSHF